MNICAMLSSAQIAELCKIIAIFPAFKIPGSTKKSVNYENVGFKSPNFDYQKILYILIYFKEVEELIVQSFIQIIYSNI